LAARLLLLSTFAALLALAPPAWGARSVYFADHEDESIAQFSVGAGGVPAPLVPAAVSADEEPRRLGMTPGGTDLYATSEDGVLQYDVEPGGQLTPKQPPIVSAGDEPHSIAVHPGGGSVYVTDADHGKVRQFDVGPGGALIAKDPAKLAAGSGASGVAVSPTGGTAYVLVVGGIVVFDVAADGSLTRVTRVEVPSCALEDVSLTPDGANLYATSGDGRLFQFDVGADGLPVAKSPASLDTGPGTKPVGLAVSPDGDAVYVAAGRGWGAGSRQVLSYTVGPDGALSAADASDLAGHGSKVGYLSASPDGRSLFVGAGDAYLLDLGPLGALSPKTSSSLDLDRALGVVVSPNQAPVASFVSAPATAGAVTRFDASSAADSDGTIVRYDWDFGDGNTLADGGPTPTHTYAQPGRYTARLVVFDNEGASTATVFTGGTVLENGAPGAQASRVVEVAAAPGPPPAQQSQQPPAAAVLQGTQAPVPDLGQTLVAEPVRGTVRVRLPGTEAFVPLQTLTELPLGSTLDTRRGRVEVSTERRRAGLTQEGRFYGGLFAVRQRKRDRFVTELLLRGSSGRCGDGLQTAAKRGRRLWGNASGRFRTRGRYSSGTVRGTKWVTVDRCDGTLTVVREGTVAVRDFTLDRTVLVDEGERYLAQAP
jgi:DNA-binding beta-propeller fold protein YncE